MKKLKQPVWKEKRSARNGAKPDANGGRDRGSSIPGLRHPKAELESAIQRYVDLYDFAPIAYVSFDGTGRIEEANLAATELLGEARDLLIGRPFAFYVADLDSFLRHLLYCRTSQQQVTTELELKPQKGDRVPAQLLSTAITSTTRDGALLYQTAIIDLRERKRHEQRMAEQARLLDLSNDAIIVRDAADKITYWNKGAEYIYGYTREEALGKITHDILKTEHLEPLSKMNQKLWRDKRWEGEIVHTRRDGTRLTMFSRWALDRDGDGNRTYILETNNDITQRKRTEEKIRESEERMRAIINQSNAGMANCDLNGRLLFANQKFCEMLGYTEPELMGKTIFAITHPDDVDLTRKRFKQMVQKKQSVEMEKRYIRRDRSFIWANVCDTPVLDAAGEPSSAVAVAIDITERKKVEAALQKSKAVLEQRVRERTRELRAANEELGREIQRRTGLEGEILEISDREQQRLGQELHDGICQHLTAVAFMARSTATRLKNHRVVEVGDLEKIAQLVNEAVADTRDLSRALHRVDVDAAGLVNALQDLINREIWKTPCRLKIKPSFHIEDDAAASHLYRIAREAVINASKHAQARQIVVELERSRKGMVLRVTDDGVGLQKESKLKQGLGFHIMNYRARSIGGRLEIKSGKQRGTCVACCLPTGK